MPAVRGFLRKYQGIIIYCLLLAVGVFFFRSYAFTYRISQHSMNNTLRDGDKVLVGKYEEKDVTAGSILLFQHAGGTYVKRCVALPGDVLHIRDGQVWINGKIQQDPATLLRGDHRKLPGGFSEDSSNGIAVGQVAATSDFNIAIVEEYDTLWTMTDFGPYQVPVKGMKLALTPENIKLYAAAIERENTPGFMGHLQKEGALTYTFRDNYYFLLGDNRPASTDSRMLGVIPQGQIIGRVKLILYSYHPLQGFSRLMTPVH